MAYIICEPCVGTKDTACVDVCPVDCIHPRKDEPEFQSAEMLYIHPDECIDCGACVPACPVEAIFALDETPAKWEKFIQVNSELRGIKLFHFSGVSSSAKIASTGQAGTQAPQSMHSSGWIKSMSVVAKEGSSFRG